MGSYAHTIPDLIPTVDQRLIDLGLTTAEKIKKADEAAAEKAAQTSESDGGAHAAE